MDLAVTAVKSVVVRERCYKVHGNQLSGKPRNAQEFDSCQGNVWEFGKSRGNVRENLVAENMWQNVNVRLDRVLV